MPIAASLLLALQAAAGPQELAPEAVVVAVKGTVDVKRPADKDWVPAQANMKLEKGASICTSVASTAELLVGGHVKLLVRPLSEASIEMLARAGPVNAADVRLKFGTVEVDIQKGELRADLKIREPHSTTSVSGSKGIVRAFATGQGVLLSLRTSTGSWVFTPRKMGVDFPIEGAGAANLDGDLPQDLERRFDIEMYLWYFGRSPHELHRGRFGVPSAPAMPWDVPLHEFGNTGPVSGRLRVLGSLPLPPGPPGP